jgi:hypothetical protein
MNDHLHTFTNIYHSSEAVIDVCETCHYKYVCKMSPSGDYDYREYNEMHKRDFLQPWQKEFAREYGR